MIHGHTHFFVIVSARHLEYKSQNPAYFRLTNDLFYIKTLKILCKGMLYQLVCGLAFTEIFLNTDIMIWFLALLFVPDVIINTSHFRFKCDWHLRWFNLLCLWIRRWRQSSKTFIRLHGFTKMPTWWSKIALLNTLWN